MNRQDRQPMKYRIGNLYRQDFLKRLLKAHEQVLVVAGNSSTSKLMKRLVSSCTNVGIYKQASREQVMIVLFNSPASMLHTFKKIKPKKILELAEDGRR